MRLELDAYLSDSLRTGGYDVVFPVSHGAVGEDGSLQGLLEVLDLPYVGSNVLASALAMNKRTAKILFAAAGLPIARAITASRGRGRRARAAEAERALRELGDTLVVKPCSNGSAIGVARFANGAAAGDLAKAIEAAWEVDDDRRSSRSSRPVVRSRAACSSQASQATASARFRRRRFDRRTMRSTRIRRGTRRVGASTYARRRSATSSRDASRRSPFAAHRALGCRDLSRVDFVVPADGAQNSEPTLLEVNTMPGFTDTSLYPEARWDRRHSHARALQ